MSDSSMFNQVIDGGSLVAPGSTTAAIRFADSE